MMSDTAAAAPLIQGCIIYSYLWYPCKRQINKASNCNIHTTTYYIYIYIYVYIYDEIVINVIDLHAVSKREAHTAGINQDCAQLIWLPWFGIQGGSWGN